MPISHEQIVTVRTAVVITKGLSNIVDGREFVIGAVCENVGALSLEPPTENNELYEVTMGDDSPESVTPVREDLPFSCESCGNIFTRSIVAHTYSWMYTVFSCHEHPLKVVYLDIFPKVFPDSTIDMTNAFMGLDTTQILPEGAKITPIQSTDDKYLRYRNRAERTLVLTSEGAQKPSRLKTLGGS